MRPLALYLQSDYKLLKNNIAMKNYKDIHLWEMHPETLIRIQDKLRQNLITQYIKKHKTWRAAAQHLSESSRKYNLNVNYGPSIFGHWKSGIEPSRNIQRNTPLWAMIEISKILSNTETPNNPLMRQIENSLDYCTNSSKGFKLNPTFPIKLTPELVSVIFHLCGDGHLGSKGQVSHYRQVNPEGLENFSRKLHNCFGEFDSPIFEESKIVISKVIGDFFKHYFNLNTCY